MQRAIFLFIFTALVLVGVDVANAQPKHQINYDCKIEDGSYRNVKIANIRIQNTGSYTVDSTSLRLKIFDCPKHKFSDKECLIIADKSIYLGPDQFGNQRDDMVMVPPGQARDIVRQIQFEHDLNVRGTEFYSCTLSHPSASSAAEAMDVVRKALKK